MQYSINNSLNQWLNSASYEDWVKNTEGLYEETHDIAHLDDATKLGCIELFHKALSPSKKLTDYPFAKWSLKHSDSKTYNLVLKKIKQIFSPHCFISEKIDPSNLLVEAASEGNIAFIQEMAKLGINFDVRDRDGITPLLIAAIEGRFEILNVLLESGADPNLPDSDGDTPLMQAAGLGHLNCVKALIAHGKININQTNNSGYHALSSACLAGEEEIVRILLAHQANIHLQDHFGRTAYVHVILYNHKEAHQRIAEMLVANMDFGSRCMHKEILRLIALTHCTNGVGFSQIKGYGQNLVPVELGGGCSQYWMKKMCKLTSAFSKSYPKLMKKNIAKQLVQMFNSGINASNQEILEIHKKGLSVILRSGLREHDIIVLIWGRFLALCNRGAGSRKAVEFFQFDPGRLTDPILDKIKDATALDEEGYSKLFFKELPRALGYRLGVRKFEERLENACMLPPQTSENCSWASLEAAVLAFLMLNELLADSKGCLSKSSPRDLDKDQVVKRNFDEWLGFNQIYHLARYLAGRSIDDQLLASSIKTIRETLPKDSKQHKTLNQMIKI